MKLKKYKFRIFAILSLVAIVILPTLTFCSSVVVRADESIGELKKYNISYTGLSRFQADNMYLFNHYEIEFDTEYRVAGYVYDYTFGYKPGGVELTGRLVEFRTSELNQYDSFNGLSGSAVTGSVFNIHGHEAQLPMREGVPVENPLSSSIYDRDTTEFPNYLLFESVYSPVHANYPQSSLLTNIPYFSTKEEMESYLRGDIDDSNAVNSDDLLTYDSEMPHVENTYISYEKIEVNQGKKWKFNTNLHFDFPESAVGMTAEIYMIGSVRCVHTIPFSSKVDTLIINTPTLKYGSVPYQNISYETGIQSVSEELFNGQTMFDIVLNSQEYADWESNRGFMSGAINTLDKMTYCVRLVDSSHTGDWVRCSIDLNGAQSTEIIGVGGGGATEDVAGGTTEIVNGDTSADDVVSGGGSVNDSYEVAPDKNIDVSLDSSNLLETVKQIFSDNGLVGIVKVIFGWMPFWLVAFISLFFTMLIALLIYRVVRG